MSNVITGNLKKGPSNQQANVNVRQCLTICSLPSIYMYIVSYMKKCFQSERPLRPIGDRNGGQKVNVL